MSLEEKFKAAMKLAEGTDQDALKTALKEIEKDFDEKVNSKKLLLTNSFKSIIATTLPQIDLLIQEGLEKLNEAVRLSETTGIPFTSRLQEMPLRLYVPRSFEKRWGFQNTQQILKELDLYVSESSEIGWEYWSTSSLSC